MDYPMLMFMLSPVIVLIGYLHIRLTNIEKGAKSMVTENEVKEILNSKLELMSLQIKLLSNRIDRVEEALDRISSKIDSIILRQA